MYDPYRTKSSILIVDDEPNNLKVLHQLLSEKGYDVRAARDGKTALEAARATHPELILLDIKMPDMTGYEVCEEMQRDEALKDIPVIFISALNNVDDIVRAFDVGGVDYVTKPFQFAEVLARVSNHLTIVHQQQQLVVQAMQLEQMNKRDQARFKKITEMREQFVQAATHDLKNPLAVIIGCADIMSRFDHVRGDQNLRDCVDSIQKSGDEMKSLVTGMLDLVRMQSHYELNLVEVDFADFVSELVAVARLQAYDRDIAIAYESLEGRLPVRVDTALMQRVVENIVSNAIKYSPDGSQIYVSTDREDDKITLTVRDEGLGITPDQMSKLFEPFFRGTKSDGERRIEGTGLGLSIVKEIVDRHGGAIQVSSTPSVGSTFVVRLNA